MSKRPFYAATGGLFLLLTIACALAQTSAGPSGAKVQYREVKEVIQRIYDKGGPDFPDPLKEKEYDLYNCSWGSGYLVDPFDDESEPRWEDDTILLYANLAYDIVVWTNNLKRLKYDPKIWNGLIAQYEAAELALITRSRSPSEFDYDKWIKRTEKFIRALASKLKQQRASKKSLRPVVVSGGCGAGGMWVNIVTEPRGAQVLFIPTFFYELCKVQKLNPDDTERCNRWREAVNGKLSEVSGDYLYLAHWPDGVTRRGTLRFTNLEHDQTVVLSKPGAR